MSESCACSDGLMDAGNAAVVPKLRSSSEMYKNPNLHFEVSGGWEGGPEDDDDACEKVSATIVQVVVLRFSESGRLRPIVSFVSVVKACPFCVILLMPLAVVTITDMYFKFQLSVSFSL